MTAVVYRIHDKSGRLIYIGATTNLAQRLNHHRNQAWWWSLLHRVDSEPFPDMGAAFDAEWAAISAEGPAFNIARKRGSCRSRAPHPLDEADAQVCRAWWHAKHPKGYLPQQLHWVLADAS